MSGTGCQADPVHGGITVRGFTPDEWELLRTLRLRSLLESPAAFASTYEEEAALPEHVWRQRASMLGVAFCDGQPVGLVGVIESEAQTPELIAMWVTPGVRGRGVGAALVKWALARTREMRHTAVELWVADDNEAAERLYSSHGFALSGETAPLPSNPLVRMHRMVARADP
jgi:GNAT superfamily N-acetyltransferase